MTGGRTGVGQPLIALEALVAVTPEGMRMRHQFRWEAAEIIANSRSETAIIELAALLEVPIGVVRVLAADLREKGAVTDHRSGGGVGARGRRCRVHRTAAEGARWNQVPLNRRG